MRRRKIAAIQEEDPQPKISEPASAPKYLTLATAVKMEDTGEVLTLFRELNSVDSSREEDDKKPPEDQRSKLAKGKQELWLIPATGFSVDVELDLSQQHSGIEGETVGVGAYVHYKGGRYRVIGEAILVGAPMIESVVSQSVVATKEDTQNLNPSVVFVEPRYVVYRKESTMEIWARPVSEFKDILESKYGERIPRFRRLFS